VFPPHVDRDMKGESREDSEGLGAVVDALSFFPCRCRTWTVIALSLRSASCNCRAAAPLSVCCLCCCASTSSRPALMRVPAASNCTSEERDPPAMALMASKAAGSTDSAVTVKPCRQCRSSALSALSDSASCLEIGLAPVVGG
jgi:hypothetical protein